MRRIRALLPAAVVAGEVWLVLQYRDLGTEFHYWVHGLLGAALGLVALALYRTTRPSRPLSAWGAGAGGHAVAVLPDILFLAAGVLHAYWMDVFALHVTIHFVPAPLATLLVFFSLSLAALVAAEAGSRRLALGCAGLGVVVMALALTLRASVPHSIEELRNRPGIAFVCPLATPR